MNKVLHTHYRIEFKSGECLDHIDIFNLQYEDVIESLMLLNSKDKEDIKQVLVTYDYAVCK